MTIGNWQTWRSTARGAARRAAWKSEAARVRGLPAAELFQHAGHAPVMITGSKAVLATSTLEALRILFGMHHLPDPRARGVNFSRSLPWGAPRVLPFERMSWSAVVTDGVKVSFCGVRRRTMFVRCGLLSLGLF